MSKSGNMLSASLLTLERFIFYSFLSCCCFPHAQTMFECIFSHMHRTYSTILLFFSLLPTIAGLVTISLFIVLGIRSFTYIKKMESTLKFDQIQNKQINQKILNDSAQLAQKKQTIMSFSKT